MSGKAVAQGMGMDVLVFKAGALRGLLTGAPENLGRDRMTRRMPPTAADATIIAAPSSTKNKSGKRDPEMSSTKKGNNWYFGLKAHTGTDASSGLVHTLKVTSARVHDSQAFADLLHGQERAVYGDKAYHNTDR